ncbi:MAG TPA: APC family permease [Gemmatimonadales bacterium]|nr:APC family permease [Gemmatimonadales bacterium]
MASDPATELADDPVPPGGVGWRLRRTLFGRPRDLHDRQLFHRLSLVPFLAWVGLGADGLSSSAYGPEEAFKALGEHRFLALGLAAVMATTVLLISAAYRRIIEEFPSGGGGYVVATKLLGPSAGVVSGSALLVDYVLTITTSLAAAGDALFSFLPAEWAGARLPVEVALTLGLTALNIRGVRESVLALLPVFVLFLATHALVIGGGLLLHAGELPATVAQVRNGYQEGVSAVGVGGLIMLFIRAYSLGGGTYTGIEAVSNGVPVMREPKVRTAKRTMVYMATSLALTASGLLLCYLLFRVEPAPGRTMNAGLVAQLVAGRPFGATFLVLTLFSEAALLVVAAQAGFLDGPRVLANMAVDSWVPHGLSALSERLTTRNGIVLMGGAALAALLYTGGDVGHLIVMYSINVFLTFSLSMAAMLRFWVRHRDRRREWRTRAALFATSLALCLTILVITVIEKFSAGGWITVLVTSLVIALCFRVRRHYRRAAARVDALYRELGDLAEIAEALPAPPHELARSLPTAAVLVGSYGGLGIHTVLGIFRAFPGHYRQVVFISVGVVDSGEFKGEDALEELERRTQETLDRYIALAAKLGVAATGRMALGTDVVETAGEICRTVAREFPRATFFSGRLIFRRERWYQRLLHNGTALAIQQRLQWAGRTMVLMPIRVREAS